MAARLATRDAFAADSEVVVMAGMGRYPKDDGSRRNRAERAFDWSVLPLEGRPGPAPKLPPWRPWTDETEVWWRELWATPQATMWDPTGRTLHALALLHHQLMLDGLLPAAQSKASSISAEMRQIEDRHGLTPKAMLQLRWKVSATPADGSGKVLSFVPRDVAERVANHQPDPALMPGKRDLKDAWVEWAVLCGADESAAAKLSKAKLIAEFSSRGATLTEQTAPPKPKSKAAERLREHAAKKPTKPGRKR